MVAEDGGFTGCRNFKAAGSSSPVCCLTIQQHDQTVDTTIKKTIRTEHIALSNNRCSTF
jgi:hypothetical protein